MTMTTPRLRVTLAGTCALLAAACASKNGAGAPYAPCADDVRAGQFTLELKPALNGAPPYAQVNGLVRDGVDPKDVWPEIASAGGCRVVVGPAAPAPAPAPHHVGTVTMGGLAIPLSMTPNGTSGAYYGSIPAETVFPPYDLGAAITLHAEGGDSPAFALEARGIAALAVPDDQTFAIAVSTPNAPLTVRWTGTTAAAAGRVRLSLDLAHHAGIAAQLRCDVPDSGTATIPGPLLDALVARGTAGFPELVVTRLTADSTMLASRCVELAVASSIARQLSVEGVTSCAQDADCTAPQVCLPELKCS